MVLNQTPTAPVVVWHELECGPYRADLGLWQRLARRRPRGPILDIGAGTGRVCLELARTGRELIAVERDGELLDFLRSKALGMPVRSVQADARELSLEESEIGLCIVPMQTIQLLGGSDGRRCFLERARACMRPEGLIACAIATEFEPYDCRGGGAAPLPEWTLSDGMVYASQALRLQPSRGAIEIERERRVGRPIHSIAALGEETRGSRALAQALWRELGECGPGARDLVVLDQLSVAELQQEGAGVGLSSEPVLLLPPTADHSGSEVVVLRV